MNFKLVVLFAFVATCSARSILGFNGCFVNIDEDSIVIREKNGRQIDIFTDKKSGFDDKIKIHCNGPDMDLKTFEIEDYQVNQGEFLSDILFKIFANFGGYLNDNECDQLLKVVEKFCETGEVHPIIFHCLKYLCHQNEDFLGKDIGSWHLQKDLTSDKLCSIYGVGCGKFNQLGFGSAEDKLCLTHGICGGLNRFKTGFGWDNSQSLYDDKWCRIFGVGCNKFSSGFDDDKWCKLYGVGCNKFGTHLGNSFNAFDDNWCLKYGVGCNKFNSGFGTNFWSNDDKLCKLYGVGCNKFGNSPYVNNWWNKGFGENNWWNKGLGGNYNSYVNNWYNKGFGGSNSPYVNNWWNKGFGGNDWWNKGFGGNDWWNKGFGGNNWWNKGLGGNYNSYVNNWYNKGFKGSNSPYVNNWWNKGGNNWWNKGFGGNNWWNKGFEGNYSPFTNNWWNKQFGGYGSPYVNKW